MTRALKIPAAVLLLAALTGCAPLLRERQHAIDRQLSARVQSALVADASLDTSRITVESCLQDIILRGAVGTLEDARRALEVAQRVPGPRSVRSALAAAPQ